MAASGKGASSPSVISDAAIIAEAKEIRLKNESFEKALGRAIRHHCTGKEAYEMYIRLISKHRESTEY